MLADLGREEDRRRRLWIGGQMFRVWKVDRQRQLIWIYGWRSVVASPLAVEHVRSLGL